MGQKDIDEKQLQAHNDVFADIVNVLLFSGRLLVKEDQLTDGPTGSGYKDDTDKMRWQDRDVTKFWRGESIQIAFLGIENQTKVDPDMVIRAMSYDAASYRMQIRDKVPNGKKYPVITLVLYFGMRRWTGPKRLSEMLAVSEELRPYLNDYQMHLFEIAFLTDEQIEGFHSDFRVVAEYFRSVRDGRAFSAQKLKHAEDVMRLLAELTKDNRYLDILAEDWFRQKGEFSMCELLDRYIKQGEEIGRAEGREEGRAEGAVSGAITMLRKLNYSEEKIIEELVSTFNMSQDDARKRVKAG